MTTERSSLWAVVSNNEFFFCIPSHSNYRVFRLLNQQKTVLFFFLFLFVLRVSFVSHCHAVIDLPCSCVIAGVDRKAGTETCSQRAEAGWAECDCPFGGKPGLVWVKFCMMPHPEDGGF